MEEKQQIAVLLLSNGDLLLGYPKDTGLADRIILGTPALNRITTALIPVQGPIQGRGTLQATGSPLLIFLEIDEIEVSLENVTAVGYTSSGALYDNFTDQVNRTLKQKTKVTH